MLTRSTQVGEFYVMSPPQMNPGNGKCMFTSDLLIYDEESDRHVRITWEDALAACCVGNDDENNANVIDGKTVLVNEPEGVENKASTWKQYADLVSTLNNSQDGWAAFTNTDSFGIHCRIVVARPFIEHLMHSVILCVSGRDTGATLFGPADMQLSANTQVKTIEGHYTGHFKAVITKPQNVLVMRDVACAGYVAGCNTQWFAKNYGSGPGMNLQTAQTEMMRRLSFADDLGAKYSSMLAFPCWAGQFESGNLDTVMSITTRLLPWEVTSASGGTHKSFPGGQVAYAAYSAKLNLRSVHFGEDMKAAENQDFISQARYCANLTPLASFEPFNLEPGRGPTFNRRVVAPIVHRARRTTPRASSDRTASLTRSPSPSCRSSQAKVTLVPTPSPGCAPRPSQCFPPCSLTHTLHNLNDASAAPSNVLA
jgi:hypothetical protein